METKVGRGDKGVLRFDGNHKMGNEGMVALAITRDL